MEQHNCRLAYSETVISLNLADLKDEGELTGLVAQACRFFTQLQAGGTMKIRASAERFDSVPFWRLFVDDDGFQLISGQGWEYLLAEGVTPQSTTSTLVREATLSHEDGLLTLVRREPVETVALLAVCAEVEDFAKNCLGDAAWLKRGGALQLLQKSKKVVELSGCTPECAFLITHNLGDSIQLLMVVTDDRAVQEEALWRFRAGTGGRRHYGTDLEGIDCPVRKATINYGLCMANDAVGAGELLKGIMATVRTARELADGPAVATPPVAESGCRVPGGVFVEAMIRRANAAGLAGKKLVAIDYRPARTGHAEDGYRYLFSDGSHEDW